MIFQLIVWQIILMAIILKTWQKKSFGVGLPLIYLFDLTINHWFGGLIYALPWYSPMDAYLLGQTRFQVEQGFTQSFYGVVAFGCGCLFIGPLIFKMMGLTFQERVKRIPNPQLPRVYLITAMIIFFVLGPLVKGIPSIGTLVSSAWVLMAASFCLEIWQALLAGRKVSLLRWLIIAAVFFPVFTLLYQGFLGFGTRMVMIIFLFTFCFYRPRWKLVLGGILALYLGLSIFVNYMGGRSEIRNAVWARQHISNRFASVEKLLANFKRFDLHNQNHLEMIDIRLNQNVFVGQSVEYLQARGRPFARGKTLWEAFLAMVPRILWPNKPMRAGSGTLVSDYTGNVLSEGTSFGIGQVMEFYINFGTPCVIIGFIVLGILITWFDRMAAIRLKNGDWPGFVFWFIPGLGLIQSGGSLVEVTSTTISAFIFCLIINKYILPKFSGRIRPFHHRSSAPC